MMWQPAIRSCSVVAVALSLVAAMVSLSFAAPFVVTGAILNATPTAYDGVCPAKITFNGHIDANGPGTVKYIFARSDGGVDTVTKTLTFTAAGTQGVTTTWTLGDIKVPPTYTGWVAIKILSPRQMESSKANFKVVCSTKQPDLAVKDAEVGPVFLVVTIANKGNGNAGPSHLCISYSGGAGKSVEVSVPSIAAGSEHYSSVSVDAVLKPSGLDPAGGLLLTADCKKEVAESNENNNTFVFGKP